MFHRSISCVFLCIGFVSTVFAADSQLELAAPFTDNMILQRQSAVPVWGFDAPGTKITVEFGGQPLLLRRIGLAEKLGLAGTS